MFHKVGSRLDFCPGNLALCSQREAINIPSRRAFRHLPDWPCLAVKVLQSLQAQRKMLSLVYFYGGYIVVENTGHKR